LLIILIFLLNGYEKQTILIIMMLNGACCVNTFIWLILYTGVINFNLKQIDSLEQKLICRYPLANELNLHNLCHSDMDIDAVAGNLIAII